MSMSKHTPGPWHVGDSVIANLDGFAVHGFPISGSGQAIARVWAGSVGKEYIKFGNQEANARLIAAAPDLLAYAKLMAANGDPDAVELIAKAEGRS